MKNITALFGLVFTALTVHVFGQQSGVVPDPFGPHLWTSTVKVVGEDGNPIVGADVAVQYTIPAKLDSGGQTYGELNGLTDTNGMFSASHMDNSEGLSVAVIKSGYYRTHIGHQFYYDEKKRHPFFTLALKKIGKPIPMYAKYVENGPPIFNEPVGYDLAVGDWVAPYGKGIRPDFLFAKNHVTAKSGYTLTVSFPNPGDGIQGLTRNWDSGVSGLLSSPEAPIEGYQQKYEKTEMSNPDRIYYFRVRTVLDDRGNVLSTHYGKIYGDFMQFRYYLNPTPNDRNIEFDPKHNLLGGLESLERVGAP